MGRSASEPGRLSNAWRAGVKDALFRFMMTGYTRLFAKKRWYRWNKLLFNLSLRGLGILNDDREHAICAGEARTLRAIAGGWGPRPTILDVGAHHGEYANMVKQLAPEATIYAFEPHPKAFTHLRQNATAHGYVAVNAGCGEKTACLPLYDYAEHEGSPHASLYYEVIVSLHKGKPVATTVNVVALDDFIRDHDIRRVDLLKIDTEGHELRVLAGLRAALAENLIDVVQFEFNAMNVISRAYLRDFYAALPQYEFHRVLLDGLVAFGEYSPVFSEIFAYQNIVAVRKDCKVKV